MKELRERLDQAYGTLSKKKINEYVNSFSQILKCEKKVKAKRKYVNKFEIIVEEFESTSGHTVTNLLRTVNLASQLSYFDVLKNVADALGYKAMKSSTTQRLEEEIVERFLEKLWGKLNDDQRGKVKNIILDTLKNQNSNNVDNDLIKKITQSGAPFAAIFAGNSAGFALYIAASSGLHALASAIGITLSFGTYTALTSGLSVLLGPLGVVAAGVFATYKVGQPSYERKLIPSIMLLTALRGEIEMKNENSNNKQAKSA